MSGLHAGTPACPLRASKYPPALSVIARAQFYLRRLNNGELANSESLWLGIKAERRMENRDAMLQLATQLVKRFPQSREAAAYQRGAFDE